MYNTIHDSLEEYESIENDTILLNNIQNLSLESEYERVYFPLLKRELKREYSETSVDVRNKLEIKYENYSIVYDKSLKKAIVIYSTSCSILVYF